MSVTDRKTHFATRNQIAERLEIQPEWLDRVRRIFPVKWPTSYLDLATSPSSAIARMGTPLPEEWASDEGDLIDPVGDLQQRSLPFVVRKHTDRIIVLVTKSCHFYCRFCFRRDEPPSGAISESDWQALLGYLNVNPEIKEVILSGGDPLTLSDSRLCLMGEQLQTRTQVETWRIHTRAPVHFPARVTQSLISQISQYLPLRVVTHYNSVSEITDESARISKMWQSVGVPYLNQAVLLRSVNDDSTQQVQLWDRLVDMGVSGHYLHHPDRVNGNARFRLTLKQGLSLVTKARLNSVNIPRYVIDLPDGTGKVDVSQLDDLGEGWYGYQHPNGRLTRFKDIDSRSLRG